MDEKEYMSWLQSTIKFFSQSMDVADELEEAYKKHDLLRKEHAELKGYLLEDFRFSPLDKKTINKQEMLYFIHGALELADVHYELKKVSGYIESMEKEVSEMRPQQQ